MRNMFPAMRAMEIVKLPALSWVRLITQMPACQLYVLRDELAAMLRHPATQNWDMWRPRAESRFDSLVAECDRRWRVIWWQRDNEGIADLLDMIYDAVGTD